MLTTANASCYYQIMKKDDMPKTDAERKAQREAWEDKHYTKQIPCPEHPKGKHTATLYEHGHRYAGIWECPKTGTSDSHDHEELEVETTEDWPTSPMDTPREYQIYVCGGEFGCGVVVDGDPAEDAYEAMIDAQIDEARERQLA